MFGAVLVGIISLQLQSSSLFYEGIKYCNATLFLYRISFSPKFNV